MILCSRYLAWRYGFFRWWPLRHAYFCTQGYGWGIGIGPWQRQFHKCTIYRLR